MGETDVEGPPCDGCTRSLPCDAETLEECEKKREVEIEVSYDDYDNLCSDCDDHTKCHKNGIDYDKITKCKEEAETQIRRESKLETQSRREA